MEEESREMMANFIRKIISVEIHNNHLIFNDLIFYKHSVKKRHQSNGHYINNDRACQQRKTKKQSKYLLDCLSDGEETSVYSVKSCTISGSGENPGGKRSEGDATDDTEK